MAKIENHRAVRRIVLGATCYADTVPALDIAVSLAQEMGARLQGLLLEDEAILHLASFPAAKAFSFRSGKPESITKESISKAFRKDAAAFRESLQKASKRAAVEYEFEQRPGNLESVVEKDHTSPDIVLLGFQRLTPTKPKSILVINGGDKNSKLQRLADSLSEKLGLQTRKASLDVKNNLTTKQTGMILEALGTQSYGAVLIPVELANSIGVGRLLEAGRCPLILLKSE